MYILEIVIIILLIRMIMNQHCIDEHIQESNNKTDHEDFIHFEGIINNIIFRITVLYKNIIYYIKHRKESK